MTSSNSTDVISDVRPDAALIELIVRLTPQPGEPRAVTYRDGQLDLYMTPESAKIWMEMLERLEALAAEHGRDKMIAIFDASTVAAHTRRGTVQ